MRLEYQRRLQAHTDGVEVICRKLGFAFHRVVTNQSLDIALFDFLRSRNRRGKRVNRRTQSGRNSGTQLGAPSPA